MYNSGTIHAVTLPPPPHYPFTSDNREYHEIEEMLFLQEIRSCHDVQQEKVYRESSFALH